jgi:hypothetical protein
MSPRNERAADTRQPPRTEEVTTVELKIWAGLVVATEAVRNARRVLIRRRVGKVVRALDCRSYLVSLEPHPGGRRAPVETLLRELS